MSEPDHGRPHKRQRAESPPIPARSLSEPGALMLRRTSSASAIAPVRGGGSGGEHQQQQQQQQQQPGGSSGGSGGVAPAIAGTVAADEGFPGHNSVVDVHPASKLVGFSWHMRCD